MGIIDAQGKLFGILNIIDAAVLVVIALLILGATALGDERTSMTEQDTGRAAGMVVQQIRLIHPELREHIAVGDRAADIEVTGIAQGNLLCKTRMVAEIALPEGNVQIGERRTITFPKMIVQGTVLAVER